MTYTRPRNILDPGDIGLIILPSAQRGDDTSLTALKASGLPVHEIVLLDMPPWQNKALWAIMDTPEWRQILILSGELGAYETALAMMALQKGFNTFFASPAIAADPEHRAERLRQASAILLSPADALAELTLSGHQE